MRGGEVLQNVVSGGGGDGEGLKSIHGGNMGRFQPRKRGISC